MLVLPVSTGVFQISHKSKDPFTQKLFKKHKIKTHSHIHYMRYKIQMQGTLLCIQIGHKYNTCLLASILDGDAKWFLHKVSYIFMMTEIISNISI